MPTDSMTNLGQSTRELVITRTFDAPRHLVFKSFADSEAFRQWWGPVGFSIEVSMFEFRPGGIFHYQMVHPDGHRMWGRFTYREIVEPERIVWVNSFADPGGNIVRAPFGDTIPLEMLVVITLDEHAGKTLLTLRSTAINATDAERATFEELLDSMHEGWGGTWDKLASYLANIQTPA
jgi:uncharacterized protein YndB with AHSA1/START domain